MTDMWLAAEGEAAKSGPWGFAIILLLCVACYFLFKSMSKHLRHVREHPPVEQPAPGQLRAGQPASGPARRAEQSAPGPARRAAHTTGTAAPAGGSATTAAGEAGTGDRAD